MKISEFKYVLMELGGGWEYSHNLYGIKANGEIYHTTDFVGITACTELDMCLAGKMDEEDVVFEYPKNPMFVMDAPTYHILEVLGEGPNDLNLLYRKEDDNVGLIEKVHRTTYDYHIAKYMEHPLGSNRKEKAARYDEELTRASMEDAER